MKSRKGKLRIAASVVGIVCGAALGLGPVANAGSVTTSFGNRVDAQAKFTIVQPDGRILSIGQIFRAAKRVDGEYLPNDSLAFARYLPNGSMDRSFGRGGKSTYTVPRFFLPWSVALQPDGGILVLSLIYGRGLGLIRIEADGRRDRSFGHRGVAQVSFRYAVNMNLDIDQIDVGKRGQIFVGGADTDRSGTKQRLLAWKLDSAGKPLESFGKHGVVRQTGKLGRSVFAGKQMAKGASLFASRTEGRKLVNHSLTMERPTLLRLNPKGEPDRSFSRDGVVVLPDFKSASPSDTEFVACQINDGKFDRKSRVTFVAMCLGYPNGGDTARFDGVIARYLPSGKPDPIFNQGEPQVVQGSSNLKREGIQFWAGPSLSPDGSVFVGSTLPGNESSITKLNARGIPGQSFGRSGTKRLNGRWATSSVGVGSAGQLYFADESSNRFRTTSLRPDGSANARFR